MGETTAVAALTLLVVALPLQGLPDPGAIGGLVLIATAIGTVVALRRKADGGVAERVLRRSALAAIVASVVLVVLVAASGQASAIG
jgi:hypothetical protein